MALVRLIVTVEAKDEFFPEDGPEGVGRLPLRGEVAQAISDGLKYGTNRDRNLPWFITEVAEVVGG